MTGELWRRWQVSGKPRKALKTVLPPLLAVLERRATDGDVTARAFLGKRKDRVKRIARRVYRYKPAED